MTFKWQKVVNPEVELNIGDIVLVRRWLDGTKVSAVVIDNQRTEFDIIRVVLHEDPIEKIKNVHYSRIERKVEIDSREDNPNIAFRNEKYGGWKSWWEKDKKSSR